MLPKKRHLLSLVLFVLLVLGGGTLIGLVVHPDGWYAALHKPVFTPPNWIFAPVWSALYLMIALAGWKAWQVPAPARTTLVVLWSLQLVLNFCWSPLFFGLHQITFALVIICGLLLTILAFILVAWRRGERQTALLMVPYGAWVSFATVLNAAFYRLNG